MRWNRATTSSVTKTHPFTHSLILSSTGWLYSLVSELTVLEFLVRSFFSLSFRLTEFISHLHILPLTGSFHSIISGLSLTTFLAGSFIFFLFIH